MYRKIVCCLLIVGLAVLPAVAEETNAPRVATEHLSEGLYENFEEVESLPVGVTAQGLEVGATAAVLMEKGSGRILFEKNPDEQRAPASITKIMTLLLTMEAIERGKLALTDRVTGSAHARSMGGSQIWLEDGEIMTVDDLLKAVCVASANDAAVALAEHIAGSEEAFVGQMNQRARELGMTNTNFVNCCGLDAEGHLTTARDIAVMSRALLDHPLITEYSTIWMDSLRNGETELVNTNKLVRFYEGATGLKTGTTDQAGYCVSASAAKNGMELIAVVLDGTTSDGRFADAKGLLNFGFANFEVVTPAPEELVFSPLPVTHGTALSVTVIPEAVSPLLVEKGKGGEITAQITLADSVAAPVSAGQAVGTVSYLLEGEKVGECRLLAENQVPRLTFPLALVKFLKCLVKI